MRNGTWKLVSFFIDQTPRLYDVSTDIYEVHDVASQYPAVAAAMEAFAVSAHVDSPIFPKVNCKSS